MGIYENPVLIWKYAIASGEDTIRFEDPASGDNSNETISAGNYWPQADASGDDIVQAFQTAIRAAYIDRYGGSATSITVDLTDDGHLEVVNGESADLDMMLGNAETTMDMTLIGWPNSGSVSFNAGTTTESTYQVAGAWYPRRPVVYFSDEHVKHRFAYRETLGGDIIYVPHSDIDSPASQVRLEFEDVLAARMTASAVADAIAASVAGATQGDPNVPFENLVRHCLNANAPAPAEVAYYDKEDTSTRTLSGPYKVKLPERFSTYGGVDPDAVRRDLRQRQFAFSMMLLDPA